MSVDLFGRPVPEQLDIFGDATPVEQVPAPEPDPADVDLGAYSDGLTFGQWVAALPTGS